MKHSCVLLILALFGIVSTSNAQSRRTAAADDAPATRYFQLTLDLNFAASSEQQPTTQTISTEVAVRDGRPGHCKARMVSQMPTGTVSQTKYIELGTKLDCDDVHMEGDSVALVFSLETSRVTKMIKTKNADGTEIDEPVITQRTVQLNVKLPLDQKKVVFDSSTHPLKSLKPLEGSGTAKENECLLTGRGTAPVDRNDGQRA